MITITESDKSTPLTIGDFKEFLNQLAAAFAAAPPLQLSGAEVPADEVKPEGGL